MLSRGTLYRGISVSCYDIAGTWVALHSSKSVSKYRRGQGGSLWTAATTLWQIIFSTAATRASSGRTAGWQIARRSAAKARAATRSGVRQPIAAIRSPELTIRCCVYVLVVGGEGTSRVSVLNNLFMNCDGILGTPNTTRIAGNVFPAMRVVLSLIHI